MYGHSFSLYATVVTRAYHGGDPSGASCLLRMGAHAFMLPRTGRQAYIHASSSTFGQRHLAICHRINLPRAANRDRETAGP
jgi:hypothetical protein